MIRPLAGCCGAKEFFVSGDSGYFSAAEPSAQKQPQLSIWTNLDIRSPWLARGPRIQEFLRSIGVAFGRSGIHVKLLLILMALASAGILQTPSSSAQVLTPGVRVIS